MLAAIRGYPKGGHFVREWGGSLTVLASTPRSRRLAGCGASALSVLAVFMKRNIRPLRHSAPIHGYGSMSKLRSRKALCPPFFLPLRYHSSAKLVLPPWHFPSGVPQRREARGGVGRLPPAAIPPDPPVACPSSRTLRGTPGSVFRTGAGCAFRAVFPIRCRICETQHLGRDGITPARG